MPATPVDLSIAHWRKSSHSNAHGADCVEIADNIPDHIPVRDSKDPQGPALIFTAAAWNAFLSDIKSGRYT